MIFLLLLSVVFASSAQEDHEDIIKKAQTLILQRERDKALQVLQFSVEKENKNTAATKKLLQTMNQMGEMVFTEKGQQILETAESLVATEPTGAIESYRDALKIEEGNVYIEARLARAHLLIDDCDNASAISDGILQTHPWYEPGLILFAQAKFCKNASFLLKENQIHSIQDELSRTYVLLVQLYLQKENVRLLRELDLAIKKFPNFSEFYWLRSLAMKALQIDSTKDKEKYNQLCNMKPSPLPPSKYLLYICKYKDKQ